MTGTNYDWVEKELDARGYATDGEWTRTIRSAILETLHTLDAHDLLSRDDRQTVTEVLRDLIVSAPRSEENTSTWGEFILGETRPGETVRVRVGAYQGIGAKHNGLTGTVVGIRGGRVLVQYLGRSDGVGHSHHPDLLEVLVK